jgi:hypothetical protein
MTNIQTSAPTDEEERKAYELLNNLNLKLERDGNKWCALYGRDLVEGLRAFGDTPHQALIAFARAWGRIPGGAQ